MDSRGGMARLAVSSAARSSASCAALLFPCVIVVVEVRPIESISRVDECTGFREVALQVECGFLSVLGPHQDFADPHFKRARLRFDDGRVHLARSFFYSGYQPGGPGEMVRRYFPAANLQDVLH
jgi:hypothetical protein